MTEAKLTRRFALVALGTGGSLALGPASLAAAAEPPASIRARQAALHQAIEDLRLAMVAGDGAALATLLHDRLNYMHSSGRSQTKRDLLGDLAGQRFFAALAFPEQSVEIVGDTGVVVQTVDQVKNLPDGKTRASRIKVLQTWLESGGKWQLLTRSSHIVSSPLSPCHPAPPELQPA